MSWEKVKLGDVIKISKGKKHQPNEDGNIRYINIEDLHNPTNLVYTTDKGNQVKQNDLIIAWDGANAGKVGIGFEGVIGSTLAKLSIIFNSMFPQFLFWYLVSIEKLIKSQRTGATIPHVNGTALKNIEIPLPPLPIQEKIAAILDKVDALRRKDQELLKKYDELARAIFIDMFGDPVKNEKGWEVKRLGELGTVVTGNTPPRANDRNYGGYIEWIKTDNILLDKIQPVKAKEYLSESGSKLGRIVSSNSILVTCIAGSKKSIGNCCLTDRTVAFNQQINAFKSFDGFYKPIFLYCSSIN